MRVAVIGAGTVGSAFATAALTAGHSVTISAAHPDTAAAAAEVTGATAADSASAVSGADVVGPTTA